MQERSFPSTVALTLTRCWFAPTTCFTLGPSKMYGQNVALLAVRSPLIHATGSYDALPDYHKLMKDTKLIKIHRDAAAVDFWRGACEGSNLKKLSNPTSTFIYKHLVTDVFLEEARAYFTSRTQEIFSRHHISSSSTPPAPSILRNMETAKHLPHSFLFHHMKLCLNALATSSRRRFLGGPIADCHFCEQGPDSLTHIYGQCRIIAAARCEFFSETITGFPKCASLNPHHVSCTKDFPLSASFLCDLSPEMITQPSSSTSRSGDSATKPLPANPRRVPHGLSQNSQQSGVFFPLPSLPLNEKRNPTLTSRSPTTPLLQAFQMTQLSATLTALPHLTLAPAERGSPSSTREEASSTTVVWPSAMAQTTLENSLLLEHA